MLPGHWPARRMVFEVSKGPSTLVHGTFSRTIESEQRNRVNLDQLPSDSWKLSIFCTSTTDTMVLWYFDSLMAMLIYQLMTLLVSELSKLLGKNWKSWFSCFDSWRWHKSHRGARYWNLILKSCQILCRKYIETVPLYWNLCRTINVM